MDLFIGQTIYPYLKKFESEKFRWKILLSYGEFLPYGPFDSCVCAILFVYGRKTLLRYY